jgi:hypothetical protein
LSTVDKKGENGSPGLARQWLPAIAAGIVLIGLASALFRPPPPLPAGPPGPPPPSVRLLRSTAKGADFPGGSDLASEDAALHDPTPLFLPTRWSSAQKELPDRPPEGSFTGYAPRLVFAADRLGLDLEPAAPQMRAAGALLESPLGSNPLIGFGRADARVPALGPRLACVSAADARTGRIVFIYSIPDAPGAPAELRTRAWEPLEFMAAVDAAGLVRPLVATARSGTAADSFFLGYLSGDFRIGDRLEPGFYRICVGP